jgi:hypothetical protein
MRAEDDRRRKLALALGSGALLTLLHAGAAHAAPGTGETSATGNQSGTSQGQTLNMTDGGVVTLNGATANAGGAGANSGINQAVGNDEENDEDNGFDPNDPVKSVNIESAENDSEGETSLTTGWAASQGNVSLSRTGQAATTRGGDNLIVLNQGAFVLNAGLGLANSGINEAGVVATGNAWALGNWADNDVQQVADITSGTSLQIIGQLELVTSLGAGIANTGINSGDITTGNATSTGSESTNQAAQDTVANGDALGAAVVQQANRTRNRGLALANTGINFGSVDESEDDDDLTQDPEQDNPIIFGIPLDQLIP